MQLVDFCCLAVLYLQAIVSGKHVAVICFQNRVYNFIGLQENTM